MRFFKQQTLEIGNKVYEVSVNNTISEYTVAAVYQAGRKKNYKLVKDNSSSFCVYEENSIGRDIFTDRADALKERDRRGL